MITSTLSNTSSTTNNDNNNENTVVIIDDPSSSKPTTEENKPNNSPMSDVESDISNVTPTSTTNTMIVSSVQQQRLHVIALFASPLVYYMNDGTLVSMQQLDIHNERMAIYNGLHHHQNKLLTIPSSSNLMTKSGNTTKSSSIITTPLLECGILSLTNLRRVLTYGGDIIHLSCHGGVDWIALEGITGETVFLGENDLRAEIFAASGKMNINHDNNNTDIDYTNETLFRNCLCNEQGIPRIKLIVLAACQSHWAASIFSEAGIPHILCVEPTAEVLDDACLTFMSEFYMTLGTSPLTTSVRTAYNVGIQAMRTFLTRSVSNNPDTNTNLGASSLSIPNSNTLIRSTSNPTSVNSSIDITSTSSIPLTKVPPIFLLYPPVRMATEINITNSVVETNDTTLATTNDDPHNEPLLGLINKIQTTNDSSIMQHTYNFWQNDDTSNTNSILYAGTVDDYGPSWARLYQGNQYSNSHLPALPEHFYGRNRAIHNILLDLLGNRKARIITLVGPQGIGKSAVSIGLSQWLALHRSLPDGLVYIDCHRITTLSGFISVLTNALLNNTIDVKPTHTNTNEIPNSLQILARDTQDLLYTSTSSNSYDHNIDTRIKLALSTIIHHLHAKRMLLIFDGIDGIDYNIHNHNNYSYTNNNNSSYYQDMYNFRDIYNTNYNANTTPTNTNNFSSFTFTDMYNASLMNYTNNTNNTINNINTDISTGSPTTSTSSTYNVPKLANEITDWTGIMDLSTPTTIPITNNSMDNNSNNLMDININNPVNNTNATIDAVTNELDNNTSLPTSTSMVTIPSVSSVSSNISLNTGIPSPTASLIGPTNASPTNISVSTSSSLSSSIPSIPLLPSVLQSILTILLTNTLSCQLFLTRRTPLGNSLRTNVEIIHHLQPLAPEDAAYLLTRLSSSSSSSTISNNSNTNNNVYSSITSSLIMNNSIENETNENTLTLERKALAIARAVGGIPARLLETVHVLRQIG